MTLLHIDNWVEGLFPAFVLGFELSHTQHVGRAPPLVHIVNAQTGGLACHHYDVIGYVLRLTDGTDRALVDAGPLVRGLQRLGESRPRVDEPFEDLGDLGDTSGNPYDRAELDALDRVLARTFRLPPVARGEEAFVVFEPDDLVRFFGEWPVLELQQKRGDDELSLVDEVTIGQFDARATERFAAHHVRALQELAVALAIDEPPRAFLTWENSD